MAAHCIINYLLNPNWKTIILTPVSEMLINLIKIKIVCQSVTTACQLFRQGKENTLRKSLFWSWVSLIFMPFSLIVMPAGIHALRLHNVKGCLIFISHLLSKLWSIKNLFNACQHCFDNVIMYNKSTAFLICDPAYGGAVCS